MTIAVVVCDSKDFYFRGFSSPHFQNRLKSAIFFHAYRLEPVQTHQPCPCRFMNDSIRDTPLTLIIEDDHLNRVVLDNLLKGHGFATIQAGNGPAGRKLAQAHTPDLILLDIMMPGESGFETLRKLKEDSQTAAIPVIILSALEDVASKVRGFELGAVDYVTKPFERMEVMARIRTNLKVVRAFRIIITEQAARLRQIKEAQEAILTKPQDIPEAGFAVLYDPVLEAGGDFYDVFPVSGGFGYVVADISGHDLKASFATSGLNTLLHQNAGPLFTPAETLTNINNVLHQVLPAGQFLTLCYVLVNSKRNLITIVSAGHPPPVFVGISGEVVVLHAEGDILGPFPNISVTPLSRPVAQGDRLYMYTDGLLDGEHGLEGETQEGFHRLAECCRKARDLPLAESIHVVRESITQGKPARDDTVLLAIEI